MDTSWKLAGIAVVLLYGISFNISCYSYLSGTFQVHEQKMPEAESCSNFATNKPIGSDINIVTQSEEWSVLQNMNTDVLNGGRYKPLNCTSRNRVAIIIPYRDREHHLKVFLRHMHPFLQRQQLDYGIFVIEMKDGLPFNRGTLMNIGFVEARKQYNYQCYIFHDVDLLPMRDTNKYICADYPKHMAVAIDTRHFRLAFKQGFGGVNAFTQDQFIKINGFSNIYFGWGREDNDLFLSTALFKSAHRRFTTDGLNTLKYDIVEKQLRPLYTWILVDIKQRQILTEGLSH